MDGEHDLTRLRRTMAPRLDERTFVYCCFADLAMPPGLTALCTVREDEGLTAIVDKRDAERCGLAYVFESRLITLTVHSALDAVGFLALVTGRLAAAGIACNAIAGYHHDHLLVPVARAVEAMDVLNALASDRIAARR
jgi:uncharacterized protein